MATLEKFLGSNANDLYSKARTLAEEESKNDPETEPYRSKYKARELYEEINKKVIDRIEGLERIDSDKSEKGQKLLTLSCILELQIGILHLETEELADGEDNFMSCLKRIKEGELTDAVSLHITVLNHLGLLWTGRNGMDKAMTFLQDAERFYHDYKENIGNTPEAFQEHLQLFEGDEDSLAQKRWTSFESIHTHTLYYLAQVYGKQNKSELSANYCRLTLQRQLKANDFNPVDWGLNAATLSQYYLSAEKFKEARHCMASGSHMFQSALKNADELSENDFDMQGQRSADLERCWIKYGLALLETSKDKMLAEVEERDFGVGESEKADKPKECSEEYDKDFEPFDLELTLYEEKVTDKLVRTFDDARKVFLFIVEKINISMKYFSLDGHCSDAIEIIQDHSKAYKHLAFFELDLSRQCKMHKRRIDMLSGVQKELNPKYYLLVMRQLMFEIAETYSSMVDLKVSLIEMEQSRLCPESSEKINKLIVQSIGRYQAYIDSLKNDQPELPSEFPTGDVRPGLVAFFCMGRLYSKFLEGDLNRRISVLTKSRECYKFVVDYCKRNESAAELVKSELELCNEMVTLLPLKMERLKSTWSA